MGQGWHRTNRRIYIFPWNRELGIGFLVQKIIISAVKMVEFIRDKMSYIIRVPRDCWCDDIVLNVHAPKENRID
jgi:hypothetical protein